MAQEKLDYYSAILFGVGCIISSFPFFVVPLLLIKIGFWVFPLVLIMGGSYFLLGWIMVKLYEIVGRENFFDYLYYQYGSAAFVSTGILYHLNILFSTIIFVKISENQIKGFFEKEISLKIIPLIVIILISSKRIQNVIKKINNFFSFIKLVFFGLFILILFRNFSLENFSFQFVPSELKEGEILTNFGICFFSFSGFESLFGISQEIEDPKKNFPKIVNRIILISFLIFSGMTVVFIGNLNKFLFKKIITFSFLKKFSSEELLKKIIQKNFNLFFQNFFYISLIFFNFLGMINWILLSKNSSVEILKNLKQTKKINKDKKMFLGEISSLIFLTIFNFLNLDFHLISCSFLVLYVYLGPTISYLSIKEILSKQKNLIDYPLNFLILFILNLVTIFCEEKVNFIYSLGYIFLSFFLFLFQTNSKLKLGFFLNVLFLKIVLSLLNLLLIKKEVLFFFQKNWEILSPISVSLICFFFTLTYITIQRNLTASYKESILNELESY